jgi:acid phosphatase (class A)
MSIHLRRATFGGVLAHRSLLISALIAASTAPAVLAQVPADKPAASEAALMILTPEQIAPQRFIAPPPAEGGAQHKAELAEVHRVIAEATPERMAQAEWDDAHEDPTAFYATIGGGFDLKNLPATSALMAVVMNDLSIAASAAKKAFPRNRPWASDATVRTCDPFDFRTTSYPSGHSTMGFTVATVFATLMPAKAGALQERARDYALSRVVCGSHYTSDNEASHAFSEVIALEMLASPALQGRIAAARAELKRAGFTDR